MFRVYFDTHFNLLIVNEGGVVVCQEPAQKQKWNLWYVCEERNRQLLTNKA